MTGKYTEFGQDLINAAKLAIDEQNAKGGIKEKKIELVTEDDKGVPTDAVTVAYRIVQNKNIIGVMGHLTSGTMLATSPIYAEAGIPVVMPVPTNPEITRQGFKNLFRVPITDDLQGAAAYDFLSKKADKNFLAIVHNRGTYGQGIANEFRKALEAAGGKTLLFEGITSGEQDYRPVIGQIKAAGAKGIFFGGEYADAARFIRQAREQGIEAPIVMGDGCFNTEIAVIAGDAVRNCYIANIAPINAPDKRAQAFYDTFRARHGRIVAYAPLGYVATCILIDAMIKSPELTREAVRKTLSDPKYSYVSIFGRFTFSPEGDSRGRRIFWHKFEKGDLVALPIQG
ncbi:MAG: branched-chain amino acid ABC transporter substrate-binding protein [Deltaproteobacteria bacterium]|nr:branched-chain amino acid ABC transporter substrate-binding protein [Deltaproteobacteria bacterium]